MLYESFAAETRLTVYRSAPVSLCPHVHSKFNVAQQLATTETVKNRKKCYLCYFGKINVIDIAHNYEFLSDEMSCDAAGDATHLRG